jgi:hypothetical protein
LLTDGSEAFARIGGITALHFEGSLHRCSISIEGNLHFASIRLNLS